MFNFYTEKAFLAAPGILCLCLNEEISSPESQHRRVIILDTSWSSPKSTRQKQYFEQRKRQQQQNSSGLESYYDKKVPRPCHENNRSLDVLSLLNLSTNGQELTSRSLEASGSLKGEHTTQNYQSEHGPNTIQVETKNLSPFEHAEIRKTTISTRYCAQSSGRDSISDILILQRSHLDASERNDDKEPKKMSTDHIDHKLSVIDMLGDDGQNSISRGNLVHEDHVAFSVEGLGRVEMETPVHSPQQPTRNFAYGCAARSKISKGSHSSKNLNCSLEDQFPELDTMAVDASFIELPPYLGELCGNSKPKIMVGKKSLANEVKDFLSNDEFFDIRVEQDRYQWHDKPSFYGDKFLDDNCGLSWKNWSCDLGSNMGNHMRSRKCDKPDFSFEDLHVQKRRGGAREAGSFNISGELSFSSIHFNFRYCGLSTSANVSGSRNTYPTIGNCFEFSEMAHRSAWPSFATEDARDCLSLSSEDSCFNRTVWHERCKNLSFNCSERRKTRGHEADSRSPYSTKKNTFTQDFCTKRLNTWEQESVICSGTWNRISDFSTPGDDWLYGERCNVDDVKLGYASRNASSTQKASPFGCKRWTEDPFESGFNPKVYVDDKLSASRSEHDAFSDNLISVKVVSKQVSSGHSSAIHPDINVECGHQESFDGLFKEVKGSATIQLSVSSGENKSVTVPSVSSMLHQHEENHRQSNYSSPTNGRSINFLGSEDNQSHFEESKVKTPEISPGPNAVLSPVCSEGGSSSVEMPLKLEDRDGLEEKVPVVQVRHKLALTPPLPKRSSVERNGASGQ
ncbi:hypothetical protein OSB04_001083, partial [Centaurea solstitialis]